MTIAPTPSARLHARRRDVVGPTRDARPLEPRRRFGWSLGLVSGTTALTDAVPLERRARTQGAVDVLVSIGGAGAGMTSGVVMDAWSFGTLGVLCAVLAVALTGALMLQPGAGRG